MENQENKIIKKRKLYAIYDRKRVGFLAIMEKTNNAVAIRDFEMVANAKDGMIKHYPDDYMLSYLGYMDEETGKLVSEPQNICEAKEVIKNEQ